MYGSICPASAARPLNTRFGLELQLYRTFPKQNMIGPLKMLGNSALLTAAYRPGTHSSTPSFAINLIVNLVIYIPDWPSYQLLFHPQTVSWILFEYS